MREAGAEGRTVAVRPSASIVVCAHSLDRWALLGRAVRSAARQRGPADELITVVDHNPVLLARAEAELADLTTVMANTGRPGLSAARNTGIAAAGGDVVVFLDDDAVPDPGWLEELLRPYGDPAVIGTGGTVSPVWPSGRPAWFPSEFDWVVGCSYRGLPSVEAPVRNPIGASMSFRRQILERAGRFDAGLGRRGANQAGCEETELGIRAVASEPGARITYVPSSVVQHHIVAGKLGVKYFGRRCFSEGRSKAQVSRRTGAGPALQAERAYLVRILPRACGRYVTEGRAGVAKAGAVALGVTVTACGYAVGRLAGAT